MLKSADNGRIDEVKSLLDLGVKINIMDKYGLYFFFIIRHNLVMLDWIHI